MPSPRLRACEDPGRYLAQAGTDPSRRRPEFSRYEPEAGERDIGVNGTFLVVRQLEQDHAALQDVRGASADQAQATQAAIAAAFSSAAERIEGLARKLNQSGGAPAGP